jgi:hypothetical protein
VTVRRPWRAVASYRLAPGLRPVVAGRCYRATKAGLTRFVDEHRAAGCEVRVWRVETIPEVDDLVSAATDPSPSVSSPS